MTNLRAIVLFGVSTTLSACAHVTERDVSPVKVSYLAFQTLDSAKPLPEAGVLRVPANAVRPMPAVLIVHGSAGVDSRGNFYASELNAAGIATFEIDMWSARNIGGGGDRPKGVPLTLPDAYAAFNLETSVDRSP